MNITICRDAEEMGQRAAADAAELINRAVHDRGQAHVVAPTGTSQFEVLSALVEHNNIAWPKIVGFQPNEYLGLPTAHPASLRRYLKERLVDRTPIGKFHYIDNDSDAETECRRLGTLISNTTIDVTLLSVAENGQLGFNHFSADDNTDQPYNIVELNEACRRQRLDRGWFSSLDEVPRRAISMSIPQIMKSHAVICSVSDRHKAETLRAAIEGPVTPQLPASILQKHPRVTFYIDQPAAALLTKH